MSDFIPLPATVEDNGGRSEEPIGEGGDRNMRRYFRILQPSVCNPQKGGRLETNNKPEISEHLSVGTAFQNGEYLLPERYFETGRLHGENRSSRCISISQNPPTGPQTTEISMEGCGIPVQGSTLWTSHSPSCVLQTDASASESPERERSKNDSISRRHINHSRHEVRTDEECTTSDFYFNQIGFFTKQKEVCARTNQVSGVPWVHGGLVYNENISPSNKSNSNHKGSKTVTGEEECISKGTGPLNWEDDSFNTSGEPGSTSLQSPSEASSTDTTGQQIQIRQYGPSDRRSGCRSPMVDLLIDNVQQTRYHTSHAQYSSGIRCFQKGLGSLLSGTVSRGPMEMGRGKVPHQHSGTKSSLFGVTGFCIQSKSSTCLNSDRQCDSNCLCQPQGWYAFQSPIRSCDSAMGVVHGQEDNSDSRTYRRVREHQSGPGIQSIPGPRRLETGKDLLPQTDTEMGLPRTGPICSSPQSPTPGILQLQSRPGSQSSGCICPEMERALPICLPTLPPSREDSEENKGREDSKSDCSGSSLEQSGVVSSATGNVDRVTNIPPSDTPSDSESTRRDSPPPPSEPSSSNRLVSIRSSLRERGISERASDLICDSWRTGTEKSYSSAWRKWDSWCSARGTDPLSASLSCITEFLTFEFNHGKQYTSINSYRSAISSTHPKIEGFDVGKHPVVCRLLQGMFNNRPPKPKYSRIWSVEQVLTLLESWTDASDLKKLSLKTAMLLALANADRASDLHLLDTKHMEVHSEGVTFHVMGLSKTRRSGPPRIVLYRRLGDNTKLCPVDTLQLYVDATDKKRKSSMLFVSYRKPHARVSTTSISRWLKETLYLAGIEGYTGHSTRAASTSAAKDKGVSVSEILKAGSWSRESTFSRYYYKPSDSCKSSYSESVLNMEGPKQPVLRNPSDQVQVIH